MPKTYSFRYPYNLTAVYQPWYKYLRDGYDKVVADLTERDRLLEDHLNLGVGQGLLAAPGFVTSPPYVLTGAYTDVPGMLNTIAVPANRQIKITVYITIANLDAVQRSSSIRVLDDASAAVLQDSWVHAALGGVGATYRYTSVQYIQPTAGTRTYQVQAFINGASGTVTSATNGESYISVEDVGPAFR